MWIQLIHHDTCRCTVFIFVGLCPFEKCTLHKLHVYDHLNAKKCSRHLGNELARSPVMSVMCLTFVYLFGYSFVTLTTLHSPSNSRLGWYQPSAHMDFRGWCTEKSSYTDMAALWALPGPGDIKQWFRAAQWMVDCTVHVGFALGEEWRNMWISHHQSSCATISHHPHHRPSSSSFLTIKQFVIIVHFKTKAANH